MTAGELTVDYLGSTVTIDQVGQTKRTVTITISVVQHDRFGHAGAYRTIITGTDGSVLNLTATHKIKLELNRS